MAKPSKLQKLKKNRPKYVYMLPEFGQMFTIPGDPIIFDAPERFVCGACLLLLKTLGARCWLPLPSMEMPQMPHMPVMPFADSKCGCTLLILRRSPSLFPNYLHADESTFMVCYLMCHCLSEIRAKVDGSFPMETSGKPASSLSFGDPRMEA